MGLMYSEPVLEASYSGDLRQLYALLKLHPQSVNAQDSYFGDTRLIASCRRGDAKTAHFLLVRGADPSLRNKKERTCLHYVCRQTLSVLDFLMICILMPILLLGYFLLVTPRPIRDLTCLLSSNQSSHLSTLVQSELSPVCSRPIRALTCLLSSNQSSHFDYPHYSPR
ncbi:hypothetical protein NQD34_014581 [Periophthalmus magnuspinnatus]|nr:hypothetical protein NQD34_014581 [Periophthalmus magnuspinnatus]